jgi:hypothetical protein
MVVGARYLLVASAVAALNVAPTHARLVAQAPDPNLPIIKAILEPPE